MTRASFRHVSALLLLTVGSCRSAASPLTVEISYSETLDSICSLEHGSAIKTEWKTELTQARGEFEREWAAVGPKLMATTEQITGKRFSPQPLKARLTLCDVPSESGRGSILVNMRYALKSFAAEPVPVRYKVNVLFHEVLHNFLSTNPVKRSALLLANRNESERVRDHLHLLALQKAVFLQLGLSTELAEVIRIDGELPGGYYRRAWELVNATDTEYRKYVAELRE
jgi:hypothetical protein